MPNSNVEAEQAVLGSLLLSREKYPEVQNADQHAESTAEDFIN